MENEVSIKVRINDDISIEGSNPVALMDWILDTQLCCDEAWIKWRDTKHMSLMADLAYNYGCQLRKAWITLDNNYHPKR